MHKMFEILDRGLIPAPNFNSNVKVLEALETSLYFRELTWVISTDSS